MDGEEMKGERRPRGTGPAGRKSAALGAFRASSEEGTGAGAGKEGAPDNRITVALAIAAPTLAELYR